MRQILWGLFKKIVIADNFAKYANLIFNHSDDYSGGSLVLGALFFTFQIYCDFSGYSDIAIGTSRLFGFDLMQNFNFPYFSRDIAEFWRRWHISLSTWFRDYLYIPLGGSQGGTRMIVRNTFIIFVVSGFWHGANWTFIIWGALNALYFLPLILTKNNRNNLDVVAKGKIFPSLKEGISILLTFVLIVFAWIFFRAENLSHAISFISGLQRKTGIGIQPFIHSEALQKLILLFFFIFFMVFEWIYRDKQYGFQIAGLNKYVAWCIYLFIFTSCLLFGGSESEFIYFQF